MKFSFLFLRLIDQFERTLFRVINSCAHEEGRIVAPPLLFVFWSSL